MIFVDKTNSFVTFEISGESLLQNTVMLWGKTDSKINGSHGGGEVLFLQLFCNGKESENKETVILRLVPHIADAVFRERPIAAFILQ